MRSFVDARVRVADTCSLDTRERVADTCSLDTRERVADTCSLDTRERVAGSAFADAPQAGLLTLNPGPGTDRLACARLSARAPVAGATVEKV